jgi:hypothetical protein
VPVPLGTTVRGRCSPIQQRDRLLAGGEDHHERLQDLSLRAGITLQGRLDVPGWARSCSVCRSCLYLGSGEVPWSARSLRRPGWLLSE